MSSSSLYYGGREGPRGPNLYEPRNDARSEVLWYILQGLELLYGTLIKYRRPRRQLLDAEAISGQYIIVIIVYFVCL